MPMNVDGRPRVRVRYWAGAAEAAGCDEETLAVSHACEGASPSTLTGRDVRALIVAAHPKIAPVLARCSLLHDGRRLADDAEVRMVGDGASSPTESSESAESAESTEVAGIPSVEILPPFVGG